MAKINTTTAAVVETPAVVEKEVGVEKSTAQLTQTVNNKVNVLEKKRNDLAKTYSAEQKYTVSGSPFYRPYFGNNMPIILNGILVQVPLDGRQYEIPESYAAVFNERIARIDRMNRQQESLAAISNNFEAYAGQRDLIHAL